MAYLLLRTQLIQSFIGFILLVRAASQASAPTITPPPNHVYQRQDREGPDFVGYPLNSNIHTAGTCAGGLTYYTWSLWAGCVSNEAGLYTGCTNASVVLDPTGKGTCSTSMACGSGLIYEDLGEMTSPKYYIRCFNGTSIPTYYRPKRLSIITTTFATTITTNALSGSQASSTSTSTSSTVSSSPTETPAPQSLAWVAGPVVGGLAGLAIIALLCWIALLLRKKHSHVQTPENQSIQPDLATKPAYQAQISLTLVPDQPPRVVSMDPSQNPRTPPYELEHVGYHGSGSGA
ncbi:unnamed protein product [Clonostachys solani]|uniref:Uncharacterized protein n=1 Tax=Clonostachys solani TaxID=160281 RepID=A0A9N9W021_9HYPO|nr:unnamed protein product [Clonostachys solani]